MSRQPCKEWRERLGAFALGHLEGAERTRVEAHVDGCPACRAEVRSLARVGEALSLADPGRVASRPMPRWELWPGVAEAVGRERRRKRRGRVAAAVVLVLVASIALLSWPRGDEDIEVRFVSSPQEVEANAVLQPRPWGTQIDLEVMGLPGESYNVWLERSDGERTPAGSFTGMEDRTLTMRLASSLDLSDAQVIGISTRDGRTVMRQEIR